jgi:creatinine amidohydrolase
MMAEMAWAEYQRRIQHEGAIMFLPLGTTEQHGPHMAIGVDHMLPTAVARSVAERVDSIVAPAVA